MSETEYNALRQTEEMEKVDIEEIAGISEKMRTKLLSVGIETAQDMITKGIDKMLELDGVGKKTAERLLEVAKDAIDKKMAEIEKAATETGIEKPVEFEFSPDDSESSRLKDY